MAGSQTTGDKVRGQEGKSPGPSDKVPKFMLSGKGSEDAQTTRRLARRSSHPLKSA